MEVLQITTIVDQSGHLNLKIPTKILPGQVNLVLVINPVIEARNSRYDFSDLVGRLTWKGDSLSIQRSLRDEW
jgi:hypothetical protein